MAYIWAAASAIIWTNAGRLLIRNLGTNFSEILRETKTSSLKNAFEVSYVKWQPFCRGLNVLNLSWHKRDQITWL